MASPDVCARKPGARNSTRDVQHHFRRVFPAVHLLATMAIGRRAALADLGWITQARFVAFATAWLTWVIPWATNPLVRRTAALVSEVRREVSAPKNSVSAPRDGYSISVTARLTLMPPP